MLAITKYIIIRNRKIVINGSIFMQDDNLITFADFIKAAYRSNQMNYLKFFKMDELSKLAFVATELLISGSGLLEKYKGEDIGLIMANASSSLDTDYKYQETIKDRGNYFPSPALFVYTLPNIMIGEICIKNKIFGENTMLVSEKFNPELMYNYTQQLFEQNKVQSCITGWVEQLGESHDAFLCLVEKNDITDTQSTEYTPQTLINFYKTNH